MYNNDYTNMHEPRKHLLELGLSESEVTVYLTMLQGATNAPAVIRTTNLKRPTVYYALSCLEKRGLISKTGSDGDKRFFVESPEKLNILVNEKIHEVAKLKDHINEILPILSLSLQQGGGKPVVTFHEGVLAVSGVIMEMLHTKNKSIHSLVPKENFFWELGEDFVERFVKERVKRRIATKNIWEVRIKESTFKKYYKNYSEVKVMPEMMHGKFTTSIFIYDTTTLYISSKKNCYAISVTSKEHADMMLALFDGLWATSTPHETALK